MDGVDWPELTPAERAMLKYARNLTIDPTTVDKEDVNALRATGFSDA